MDSDLSRSATAGRDALLGMCRARHERASWRGLLACADQSSTHSHVPMRTSHQLLGLRIICTDAMVEHVVQGTAVSADFSRVSP
jgi:hypothetical protein